MLFNWVKVVKVSEHREESVLDTGAMVRDIVILLVLLIGGLMWGMPQYRVWSQEMAGKAALAEATENRRIAVEEAMATMDSAKHYANAEIERARGVAEANKIIGESLKNNREYLQYLWITQSTAGAQRVYLPSDGYIPMLEASNKLTKDDLGPKQ